MRPLALIAAAALAGGCGAVDERTSRPRPPGTITVTAAVTGDRIVVSPREFGAGPVVVLIANQTDRSQTLTFESLGAGVTRTTRPIAPAATASLELDVPPGRHRLRAETTGVRPAALRAGAPRPSAQDELLTP